MSAANTTPDLLVEAKHLSVSYGAKRAVDDISFTIPKGRVVGLLGHNGAGKTTLMKAMVGLTQAQGDLAVLGLNPMKQRVELLQSACYIPDVAILPRWARVQDLITFGPAVATEIKGMGRIELYPLIEAGTSRKTVKRDEGA